MNKLYFFFKNPIYAFIDLFKSMKSGLTLQCQIKRFDNG